MAVEWVMSNQAAHDNGAKIMVYSPSGMGKTVLCAGMPRPMIISNESGLLSLKKSNLERLFPPAQWSQLITYDIPVAQIKTVEELESMLLWAQTSTEAAPFDSICLDSASELAEVILTNAKATVKDPRQAYGDLATRMTKVVRGFRDLKSKNVYLVCKMEAVKDEVSGMVKNGPSFPGQILTRDLPYLFDELFQYGITLKQDGTKERYLRTQPDIQNQAKDRSGSLLELEYPHLGTIINKIRAAAAA